MDPYVLIRVSGPVRALQAPYIIVTRATTCIKVGTRLCIPRGVLIVHCDAQDGCNPDKLEEVGSWENWDECQISRHLRSLGCRNHANSDYTRPWQSVCMVLISTNKSERRYLRYE